MQVITPLERTFRFQLRANFPPLPGADPDLRPFDFAIIRYVWTSEQGQDMDTRTAVSVPPRLNDVGWARNANDPNPDANILLACQVSAYPVDLDSSYLTHGGDNCGDGVEAIVVNLKKLAEDFPDLEQLQIRLRCFWYNQRRTGYLTIQFETYLGGTMTHVDYDFVNVGGALVDMLNVDRNAVTQSGTNIDGDEMGYLTYTVATKTAIIEPPPSI